MRPAVKYMIIGAVVLALTLGSAGTARAETLIIGFEVGQGRPPILTAIPDAKCRWQIGFGSTWHYDQNRWVRQGDIITAEQAYRWLRNQIREKEQILQDLVEVPINSNQRDSLLSLMYNIGTTAFTGSTLLRYLNDGRPKLQVADQFDVWRIADGVINQGLVNRRAKEKALFLS